MGRHFVVLMLAAAAFGLVLDASPARAQVWDDRPNLLPDTRHGIWGELSIFGRGGNDPDPGVTVVSPMLHANFGIGRRFELGLSWGFGYHDFRDDEVVPANPYVSARYVWTKRQHRFRIGGGLAIPVPSPDVSFPAATIGEADIRGWWSIWSWWPRRLSLVAPDLRWEFHGPVLYVAAEGALGLMLHTGSDDGDPEVAMQMAGELGARLSEPFILGLRLQVVGLPTVGGDNAQVAMAPFAQIDFGRAFLFSRLLLNLDDPLGFAFDDHGWWSLSLGGGGRF